MYHVVVFEKLVVGGWSDTKPRHIPDEHLQNQAALAYAFELPPLPVTRFELSSSWTLAGSARGATRGGASSRDGLVYRLKPDVEIGPPGTTYPLDAYRVIGKVRIMQAGEKVHDRDPVNASDFYHLGVM